MKLDYEYKIQRIDSAGLATVEYRHESLGSITRVFFVPYNVSESVIHRVIKENFPYAMFNARYLSRTRFSIPDTVANLSGKMSVSFDDYFYDLNIETIEQNEKKTS